MSNAPNLFHYATSELSQDAFLCWLIKWADTSNAEHDEHLHGCGKAFLSALMDLPKGYEIKDVKVLKQRNNIDVSAIINKEYFLVIEDKKGTSEHSNQLSRYAEIASKKYPHKEVQLVYFKMENQGNLANVKKANFKPFSRTEMLTVLEKYLEGAEYPNAILNDYYEYLIQLDEQVNSYKTLPLNKWGWYSWQGFLTELQTHLKGNWGYVNTPSGGFWGFWWGGGRFNEAPLHYSYYMQLENDKLCFKMSFPPDGRPKNKVARNQFRSKIRGIAKDKGKSALLKNAGRCTAGKTKTTSALCLKQDYRQKTAEGLIDIKATVALMKEMEDMLSEV